MRMEVVVASLPDHHPYWDECVGSLGPVRVVDGSEGLLTAYQKAYETSTADIIAYIHNDVIIRDAEWRDKVLREFDDPSVGVAGFGGAFAHGEPDIYKMPYRLTQLRRIGYMSNTDDAELHGDRFEGVRDVAALDGFALIIRRGLLDRMGGWLCLDLPPHHNYDYLVTLSAARFGYRCRLVGVKCLHLGGMTATSPAYAEWAARSKWGSDDAMHAEGHRIIYEEFRDVLPVEVTDAETQM